MINLSECFNMVGTQNCFDVASSLGLQGVDQNSEISIPIYEVFFLKILSSQKAGFICDSLGEFTALREMSTRCGSVAIALNIADIDLLTLIGAVLIATPNTGMNVFMKLNAINVTEDIVSMAGMIADAAGVPVPEFALDTLESATQFIGELLQTLFDKLIETLQDDLASSGINLYEWDRLGDYYETIKSSGEMVQMQNVRSQLHAPIF